MSFAFGTTGGGAFGGGGTSAFGGGGNAFGAAPAATGAAASPFGGGAAGGGFGAAAPSAFGGGGGGFGSAIKPAATGFGTAGAFGAAPATGGMFGAQPAATSAFGAAPTSGGGMFGAPAASPGGAFGATVASPTPGFGAATTTAGAFGGGSAFGTNTGFGAAAPAAGGFGANAAASPFGAPKPAAASPFGNTGAFGAQPQQSAFGGGSTFGTPAPAGGNVFGGGATTSAFGAKSPSPFGGGAGAFGAPATQSGGAFGGFGASPTMQQQQQPQQPQVGTGVPPWEITREADGVSGMASYYAITRLPAYAHKSLEELRHEDYLKRTNPQEAAAVAALNPPQATAPAQQGFGFGGAATTSAFGGGPPASTGAFGSTFGSTTSTAPSSGGFGAFNTQPASGGGLFGSTTRSIGGFGTAQTQPAAGFGATSTQQTGGFGAPASGGFGTGTSTFGNTFGATAPQPTTAGFGGFGGGNTGASAFGAGASAFNAKPATSGGFGFNTQAPAQATGGFGFGQNTAAPQQAAGSLFGGAANTGTSGFSFNSTPKPAASTGFGGFGTNTTASTGSFGSTPGGFGSAGNTFGTAGGFGAGGAGGFGATSTQASGGSSLFGGTPGSSFGGFNSATPGQASTGTSLFNNTQKPGTSLFGNTGGAAGTATGGGLFGSTATGGTSLFGGAATATKPSTGFGFGSSGGLTGTTGTTGGFGGFGSFGAAPTGGTNTGTGFGGGGFFGSNQAAAPAMQAQPAQPSTLVATPDVNPYGAGAFGAGLVEQNVKAALDLQSLKPGSSAASRLNSFAQDVGLPRGAMENSVSSKRNLLSSTRHSIPVSFIREAGFKGSKSRFSTITSSSSSSSSPALRAMSAENVSSGTRDDEFKFSSSLFRNSVAKRLVINRPEQRHDSFSTARPVGARASVVPFSEDEPASKGTSVLKADDEGYLSVVFRTLLNKKSFTLRLKGSDLIQSARDDVKRLLRSTMSSTVTDVQLLANGRVLHDSVTVAGLSLREGDVVDVAVVEYLTDADDKIPSSTIPKPTSANVESKAPSANRFMSYSDFLNSAIREEEESAVSDASKPVAASCPSLKNPDYYTVPSYDRLKRMSDDELSGVENFTVGCKGLGSVEWIGHIDVRNLDLDELIHFEKKEVIVYKDDENKHELGTGLNRPAIVELLGIFPPRKVQDPDSYREKVKQRTRDIGSTFIDYAPATGVWRFRVEHFSRYGLDDDDDDEDMDKDAIRRDARAAGFRGEKSSGKMAAPKHPQPPVQSRTFIASDRLNLVRNSAMYRSQSQVSSASVATFLDQDDQMQVETEQSGMRADDARQEDEIYDEESEATTPAVVSVATSTVFPVSPDILRLQPLGIDNETSLLPRGSKSATYQMFLQVTGQTHTAKHQTDAGLFLARSFRCSWGPNGQLVNIARPVAADPNLRNAARSNIGRHVTIEYPLRTRSTASSVNKDALELHYACCQMAEDDAEETPVRVFALPTDDGVVGCLRKYVTFADRVRQQHPESNFYRRTALLWKLIQALWGQEHDLSVLNSSQFCPLAARDDPREIESMETFQMIELRREAISRWFEVALAAEAPGTDVDSSEAGILKLLCQHRIVEASEMAIECGDFRLATLLAQAASYEGGDFRSLLADQLSQWSENGTLEFIEEDVVMIYSLLAGSVEVLTSRKEENVSWLGSLALFFWYKRGPATSLKTALTLYREAVTKQRAKAPHSQIDESGQKDDVLMEVMKLYVEDAVSLCSVLSPSGFPADDGVNSASHLDYELSWHLHSVLRAIGFQIDRTWESHLHQNYIRQLHDAGLWEQAVYVALNISDEDERVSTVRQLLFRNADILAAVAASKRVELCDKYGLPMEWIEEALAARAVSNHAHREEIAHWIAARQFEDAHACLTRFVAPMCIFAGEKTVLVQLLEELEPSAAEIPQWNACRSNYVVGGGLLLEYLRCEHPDALDAGHEHAFLDRLMHLAGQLSQARGATEVNAGVAVGGGPRKLERELLVARTALSSMLVALSTQAVQLSALLAASSNDDEVDMEPAVPVQLRPAFLDSLSSLSRGRETKFVESYRSSQLLSLCASFVDWRS